MPTQENAVPNHDELETSELSYQDAQSMEAPKPVPEQRKWYIYFVNVLLLLIPLFFQIIIATTMLSDELSNFRENIQMFLVVIIFVIVIAAAVLVGAIVVYSFYKAVTYPFPRKDQKRDCQFLLLNIKTTKSICYFLLAFLLVVSLILSLIVSVFVTGCYINPDAHKSSVSKAVLCPKYYSLIIWIPTFVYIVFGCMIGVSRILQATQDKKSKARQGGLERDIEKALNHQQIENTRERQTDLIKIHAGFTEVQGEHNVQQALLVLRNNADHCFKLINEFQESYNTVVEMKKAVENVGILASFNLFGSNSAKTELNNAEGAHKKMTEILTPALRELMTAFTSFSAEIGSIQLQGASEDQVTAVINTFEAHIRDLTDEVSKKSNVQIENIEQYKAKMRSLLDELSDKLQFDANNQLVQLIKKQEELLRKMRRTPS